ncbi:hypothetical protein CPB86DRAFT_778253 [Serendipita vermifera]|nr:hypothetical protein CPB86DRAFT_778253 [Serendipita vermifera]
MLSSAFNKLPPELVIYISANLDLNDLVSLAQVNQRLRQLSKTSKMFWMHSIIRQGALLPLTTNRPLESFTAEELRCECHRAVIRDRNLSMDEVKIQSCTRISWPYIQQGPEPELYIEDRVDPNVAGEMFTVHPNGEWIFLVSSTYVMRIFHVRTQRILWSSSLSGGYWLVDNEGMDPLPYPMIEFVGESKVLMVNLYIHEYATLPDLYHHIGSVPAMKPVNSLVQLRLWEVSLCSQTLTVTTTEVTSRAMDSPPSRVDLAGDFVLVVEEDIQDRIAVIGQIRLFDWTIHKKVQESKPHFIKSFKSDLQQQALGSISRAKSDIASDSVQKSTPWITLPTQLLPTIVVSLFPEYLISLGACQDGHIHLQVLAFPLKPHSEMPNSPVSEQSSSDFVLAADIFLLESYSDNPEWSPRICHKYIGRHENHITICIPDEQPLPRWHIFEFYVDFRKPPEQWFPHPTTGKQQHCDQDSGGAKPKRFVYDTTSPHWALPLIDGKRFFCVDDIQVDTGLIFLSLFHIEDIPPIEDPPVFENESDADIYHLKQVERYPKKVLESPIRYPSGVSDSDSILGFDFQEQSGTAIIFICNGDIWVLRYGHA